MKTFTLTFLIFTMALSLSAQSPNDKPKLPKTWDKDLQVKFSFTGSMDGSNTHLTFTYDSMTYTRNSGMTAPKTDHYKMKEADRVDILKKLRELKFETVKSDISPAPVNDGWSTLLCVGSHCVQGGTSTSMTDKDKETFSLATDYLQSFALSKSKKK